METTRLRLRRFHGDDLDNIQRLESDGDVMKHTPMKVPLSRDRSAERLARILEKEKEREPLGIWAAETKQGEFVGWFMLLPIDQGAPELGFMIVKNHWGKGYASEAGGRLLAYALDELKLPKILAVTTAENFRSQSVLRRIGFTFLKTIPEKNGAHLFECAR